MENAQLQIQNEHRSQLTKYRYYIIGLSVTSIGFSVYQTTGQNISIFHIPLAFAIVSWGISIYLGLRYIHYYLKILFADNSLFNIKAGHHEIAGTDPIKIHDTIDIVFEAINVDKRTMAKIGNWQVRTFYSGAMLFIIWHVITMFN